nr:hypothetical protein [Roseobacter litoralis]
MPRGFDDRQQRDPNRFTHAEAGQAKRAKRDTVALKKMFRACWDGADNQQAFAAALADQGYALARGNRRGLVAVDADGKVWSLSRWCGVKPRALAQKITDIEQLPAVDAARALAQALPAQAPRPQTDSKIKVLAALVAQQRGERADLVSQQKLDEATRVAQQPKGLQIAFMKMTGRFDAHVDRCARQAAATQAAAQLAQQDLIDRHLTERRALMPAPAHKPTQQRLEIKAEPTGLTRERLIAHPTLILDELSKTRAAFTRTDTLRALSQWIDDPQTLSKLADGALKSSEAVRLSSDKHPVYTTIDYQKAETQLHQSAAALRADKTSPVMSSHITTALAAKTREMRRAFGWALSAEQEAAVRHVTGPERLANVEGLAGAGKSTMLETATDAWRKKGVTVHGAALAGKAADGLQEASGIQSRTLASLELSWENGQPHKGDHSMSDDTKATHRPEETLREGTLKAAIWRNEGEKGAYHSVTVARTYKDGDGNLQDTQNFRPKDMLGLSELARQAHHTVHERDREMFKEQRREGQGKAQSRNRGQSR